MDSSSKKEDHYIENNLINLEESYVIPPTNDLSIDPSNKEDHSIENNLVCLEESYVIPSPTNDSVMEGSQESEEEDLTHDFCDYEACHADTLRYTPERLYQELSYQELSGSDDCIISDEWQELNKSDYAKVIFCDLYYHADSGGVGCKFQITDNVHEDPCDYVGLFRIGFESLTQCLVSKMLSETECEEDGKLLRCDFSPEDLPDIEAGFYQFLYITRDKEICGASMPFEIKQAQQRDLSPDCIITEKGDDDFLLVRHGLEKKNQLLEELLAESQEKNRELTSVIETLTHEKDTSFKEKEIVIESLQKAMMALKEELDAKVSSISETNNTINTLSEQIPALNREISVKELLLSEKDNIIKNMSQQIDGLLSKEREANSLHRANLNLSNEVQKLRAIITSSYDHDRLTLMEQLDDQKFMIKALEDSKQLALKEMNDLSESLSRRTIVMNQLKYELDICKAKLKDLTEALDKRTEELEDATVELAAYKLLKEPAAEIQQTEELERLTAELAECQEKLKLSHVSESQLTKDLETVTFELTDCKTQLEQSHASENELSKEVATLATELGFLQNEIEESIKTRKVEADTAKERLIFIRQAVKKCTELQNEMMSVSLSKEEGSSSYRQEICRKKCEILAYRGKIKDVEMLLKTAENSDQGNSQIAMSGPCKVNKKCLKRLENLHYVQAEDIAYINDLTERINRRESGCILQAETVPGSEINIQLKNALLCVDRIINAVKYRLWNSNDWSNFVDGYRKEYAELSIELQIEMILAECKSQYQIEILLEHAGKNDDMNLVSEMQDLQSKNSAMNQKLEDVKVECEKLQNAVTEKETKVSEWMSDLQSRSSASHAEAQEMKVKCGKLESIVAEKDTQVSKLSDKLCDLQSKCMLLEEELQDLRMNYGELQSHFNASNCICSRLKDECMKKDALIEFLKTEKGNLSSKQMELQETVIEHTARLTEAAELYKKQFKEIEKLKKKLKKIQTEPYQLCASSETSDPPVVVLNDESKTSSPVHEIFYPARSSSDSDTGEHVSGESTHKETKEKYAKAARSRKQHNDEKANQFKAALTRTKKCGTNSAEFMSAKKRAVSLGSKNVARFLFRMTDAKLPPLHVETTPKVELYPIPCPMCDLEIHVSSKSTEALTNHLEKEHHMSMCPICGHFFEGSVPEKYLAYHIEGHFKNDEKAC